MDMKKHIYLLLLLCSVSISYPAFTGREQEIKHYIICLIEEQLQANKKQEEAWNAIIGRGPNECAHSLPPETKESFKKAYPVWIKTYKKSPQAFRQLFE